MYSLRATPVRLILLLGLFVAGLAPATIQAAEITVHEQRADPNFPNEIVFEFQATVSDDIEQVELRYRPVDSSVTRAVRLAPPDDSDIDIVHNLDMRTRYLPPGIDIVYRWHLVMADGSTIQTPEQTFHYIDDRYDWDTMTEGQVTLYTYTGDETFRRNAMDVALQTTERFKEAFNLDIDDEFRIVMYGNNRDFGGALPPSSAEWIGGFADPELGIIATGVEPTGGQLTELRRILSHEVIHLIIHAATENPFNGPPAWLDEGLATYYQDVPDVRYPAILRQAIDEGRLIPLRALNASFPDDPDGALLSYAESESIVQFIVEEMGTDKMSDLITAYQAGVSHEEAVQNGLGLSLDELERDWKDWLGYEGDQEQNVAVNGSPDDNFGLADVSEALARWGALIPMMLAAFACLVIGTKLIIRRLNTPEEPS